MTAARIVLSILLALTFAGTGAGKLGGLTSSQAIRDSLNISPARWKAIGSLEIVGVIGFVVGCVWVPATIAAALGIVALMIGALVSRRVAAHGNGFVGGSGGVLADSAIAVIALATVVVGFAST